MQDTKSPNRSNDIGIAPIRAEDRATIALTMPQHKYLAQTGWGRVASLGSENDDPIIGFLVASTRPEGEDDSTIGFRTNILKEWFSDELLARLVNEVAEQARSLGARRLKMAEHLPEEAPMAIALSKLGFMTTETFDTFENDLDFAHRGWKSDHELFTTRLKFKQDYEVVEMTDRFIRPTAQLWAREIGGNVEQHVDLLDQAIAGFSPTVDLRYSRIAIEKNEVVALLLANVVEHAMKITALAVRPSHRLTGIQTQMLLEAGTKAIEDGATVQVYDAGRLQPDTQSLARRIKARLLRSSNSYELILD